MLKKTWDERRRLIVPGDTQTTLHYCADHFISCGREAIENHGLFAVALSGGSTPKAIFELLGEEPYSQKIDWSKVHLFWGDERSVPPDHPDSNYRMAMATALGKLPIPKEQIHRMHAEDHIEQYAREYEKLINKVLNGRSFDLITLGMGEDGHTASLFPNTDGLHAKGRLVIANFVPQLNTWRMSLTYECINQAHHIDIYVLGANKKHTLCEVLQAKENRYPIQKIGTKNHPALWIVDDAASRELICVKH